MAKVKNEIGNRYGKLLVIEEAGRSKYGHALWKYKCDCGNVSITSGDNLRSGATKSCGCSTIINEKPGTRYGMLVVIGRAKKGNEKRRDVRWKCRCDCGNVVMVIGHQLRCGSSKSCGCLRKRPKGEAAFNLMLKNMKNNAKTRGYDWDLTREQVLKITKQNCFYCGASPSNISSPTSCNGNYAYNGIDRINNKIGYITTNVVPCCRTCNSAKKIMTVSEFLRWIEQVSTYKRRKK